MAFVDTCPPIVVERVMHVDLASAENSELFSWIASQAALECQVKAVGAVAGRIRANSHPQVIDDFCASVATYARFLDAEAIEKITGAYLRMPYYPAVALNYFNGLIQTGIDIRPRLKKRVVEDWRFTHPRKDAATWHYYMYLASLGEPGAIERLAEKIEATEYGNDATNLLQSLSELKADGVVEVLERYADDTRRADGTEEPGMMISENVRIWLMMRAAE